MRLHPWPKLTTGPRGAGPRTAAVPFRRRRRQAHGDDRGVHQGQLRGDHDPRHAGVRGQPQEGGEHDQAGAWVRTAVRASYSNVWIPFSQVAFDLFFSCISRAANMLFYLDVVIKMYEHFAARNFVTSPVQGHGAAIKLEPNLPVISDSRTELRGRVRR